MPIMKEIIFEELEQENYVLAGDGYSKFGNKFFGLMVFYYSRKFKESINLVIDLSDVRLDSTHEALY